MTKLLEQAIAELSKLPVTEQDAIAAWLLEELASERDWEKLYAESHDELARMADEALVQQRSGRVQELDPDAL